MVISFFKEAVFPPLFFSASLRFQIVLYALIVSFAAPAQKLKKHYVSSFQGTGNIYFIKPQKGFKNKAEGSKLVYDMTSVGGQDSLTFNFSFFDSGLPPDSIYFHGKSIVARAGTKKIFIESKGKRWFYRYSARISMNELKLFFTAEEQGEIIVVQKNLKQTLKCSASRWKKLASLNYRLLQLIEYNKPSQPTR